MADGTDSVEEIEDTLSEEEGSPQQRSHTREDAASFEDYKAFYSAIEVGFRNETSPSSSLERAIDAVKAATTGSLPVDNQDYFLRMALPKFVQYLLQRNDLSNDLKPIANEFFMLALDLIIQTLPLDLPELHISLSRIFSNSVGFYTLSKDKNGKDLQNDKPKREQEDDKDEKFVRMPKGETSTASNFLQITAHFGKKGGFDAIITRINQSPPVSLVTLKALVRPIVNIKDFLTQSFLDSYVPKFQEAVFNHLLLLTGGDFKRDEKILFTEIGGLAQELLGLVWTDAKIEDMLERFNLDVALKSFMAPTLEKRLRGLKFIKKMVGRTELKRENAFLSTLWKVKPMEEKENEVKPVDPKMLSDWLKENEVIPSICKSSAQPEVIKQSLPILIFVAKQNQLDAQYLEVMFEGTLGKHESVKHTIYTSLIEILNYMPIEAIDPLFEQIKKIPYNEYDTETLLMLQAFTTIAVGKATGKNKWYGLTLFWQLILDETPVSLSVANRACSQLIDLLNSPLCQSQRGTYMDLCVENLKANKSVPQSLNLLLKIFATYPFTKRKKQATAVIESLEQRFQLLQLFITELVMYKSTAKEKGLNENGNLDIGRYSHKEHIQIRLSFLDYVLTNSEKIVLSVEQVNTLWDCLVTKALSDDEREGVFLWLEQVNNKDGFNESVIDYLFTEKMSSMDCTNLSRAGFGVYDRYFLHINEKQGKVKRQERRNDTPEFFAISSDLVGLQNMWVIALDSKDPAIGWMAANRLNMLHQYMNADSLKPKISKLREDFLRACMKFLSETEQRTNNNISVNEARIERCLVMLKTYVQEFEERTKRPLIPVVPKDTPATKQIKVWAKTDKGQVYMVYVDSTDTVKALKYRIAEQCGESARTLKLLLADKEIRDEGRLLQDLRIEDGSQVTFRKRNAPEPPKKPFSLSDKDKPTPIREEKKEESEPTYDDMPVEALVVESLTMLLSAFGLQVPLMPIKQRLDDIPAIPLTPSNSFSKDAALKTYPNRMLASEEYFDPLYKLLNYGDKIGEKVWELLNLLPRSEKLYNELSALQTEDWDQLIDSKSTFKLIYSLQIIDSLLSLGTVETSQIESGSLSVDWAQKFVNKGGLQKVMSTFLTMNDKGPHLAKGTLKSYSLLLKIINFLVLDLPHRKQSVSSASPTFKPNIQLDVDKKELINKLVHISWGAAASAGSTAPLANGDNLQTVQYSIQLLLACMLSGAENLLHFFEVKSLREWLLSMILETPEKGIREEVSSAINLICDYTSSNSDVLQKLSESPPSFFLSMLLSFLPQIESWPKTCDQYFKITAKLLRSESKMTEETKTRWHDLLYKLISMIIEHPTLETSAQGEADIVIGGLLDFTRTLLRKEHSLKIQCIASNGGLIDEVFRNCLFAVPTASNHGPFGPPKCKTQASREAGLKLLTEAAKDCPENYRELVNLLFSQTNGVDLSNDWQYLPTEKERSALGYVGLVNLGATCYMNSLLQQLFLIPEFRKSILSVEVRGDNKSDNVLYQLQLLFAFLQESAKKFYDTTDFCATIKDYEGRPINTSVQMDCNEFSNMLFDRLESLLKTTPQEKLLQRIFGGALCNQLICKECPHGSETVEPFFTLSVEVSHKKNIYESLDLFVQGEMLVGENKYFCETCNKGVDTLKRYCIKHLPNTLLVHLKRFEFDYDKMKHVKINDYCEFPMNLNLEPYTKEGMARREAEIEGQKVDLKYPSSYYEYELVGIVVHMGTADCGHYYSYIKERVPQNSSSERRWIEYNDTKILPFDAKWIPYATFGGTEEVTEYDKQTGKQQVVKRPKSNNAYILVYERAQNYDEPPSAVDANSSSTQVATETVPSIALKPSSSVDNFLQKLNSAITEHEQQSKQLLPALVPPKALATIWDENMDFLLEKYVLSSEYFTFIWGVVNLYQSPATQEMKIIDPFLLTIQYATRFIVEILVHSRDKPMFQVWISHLKKMFDKSITACRWFLEALSQNTGTLKQMFLHCPLEQPRIAFADIITHAIIRLAPEEQAFYEEDAQLKLSKEDADAKKPKSSIICLIDCLLSSQMLKSIRRHPRHCAQYFLILKNFASISAAERKYLVARKVIARYIEFTLGLGEYAKLGTETSSTTSSTTTSSTSQSAQSEMAMYANRISPPNLTHMLELFALIIKSCATPDAPDTATKPPTQLDGTVLTLSTIDEELIFGKQFITKMLRESVNIEATLDIAVHLCWESKKGSKFFVATTKEGLSKSTHEQFKPYLKVLTKIMGLKDSLQSWRVDAALCSHLTIIESNVFRKESTDRFVKYLVKLANKNEEVKLWLFKHKEMLNKVLGEAGYKII